MKRIKIAIASVIIAMSVASCDSYLSEIPDNRTQIDSSEKVAELLVSAYPQAIAASFLEDFTDNVFDSGIMSYATRDNNKNYQWELNENISTDSPSRYWDACYEAIAVANHALEAIEEMGETNDVKIKALKSEALLARAYAHFQLVLIWGKTYNPATSSTDLGVPYVDKVEQKLVQKYTRNTVAEVYDRIEADLIEGMKFIRNDYKSPSFHFTVNAANAFASKFYLSKGDWDNVLKYTNYLGSKPANVIRDVKGWHNMDLLTAWAGYTRSTVTSNLLLVTTNSRMQRIVASTRFTLTGVEKDKIFSRNRNPIANKSFYSKWYSRNSQKTTFSPKYWEYFKVTNPSAQTGFAFSTDVLLSNDETYLNRIEALIMTNRFDEAMTELEFFISTRTQNYDASTDKLTWNRLKQLYPYEADKLTPFYGIESEDQGVLLNALLETKRRDFIHEGKRWFDIKRMNMIVVHKTQDGEEYVLAKDDTRRQLALPLHVVAGGLVDNPKN